MKTARISSVAKISSVKEKKVGREKVTFAQALIKAMGLHQSRDYFSQQSTSHASANIACERSEQVRRSDQRER